MPAIFGAIQIIHSTIFQTTAAAIFSINMVAVLKGVSWKLFLIAKNHIIIGEHIGGCAFLAIAN